MRLPRPAPIAKFIVITLQWPKGAPTAPELVASGGRFDFDAQRGECFRLIDAIAAKDLASPWPDSAAFGPMKGHEISRLQAKHLDHHFRQFSA